MIYDSNFRIVTSQGEYNIILTAQQKESTIRRRIHTLVPGARVLDMHEDIPTQGDLLTPKPRKRP